MNLNTPGRPRTRSSVIPVPAKGPLFSAPRVDGWLLAAVVSLVAIGVVMVGASSPPIADSWTGDPLYFLKRQLVFAVLGALAFTAGAAVDSASWQRRAPLLLGAAFVLLVLVLVPGIGSVVGGARRWIVLGPVGLQAGEAMKIAVVMFLAAALAGPASDQTGRLRAGKFLFAPALAAGLLLCEPDFGTAVLILVVALIMIFAAGARLGTLAGVLALALPAGLVAISTSAYRMRRVLAFLDPWSHRHDIGYQITESLMTLGSGGVLGLGLGASRQKLFFLPAAHTDFVFAVIGEELGFIGVAFVVACFAVIGWRALRAAAHAKTAFSSLLILGLSSMVLIQAVFNMAVVLGLVPTKGITLPFVSYGGSSLVMAMLGAGLLMRACADVEVSETEVTSPMRRASPLAARLAGDA